MRLPTSPPSPAPAPTGSRGVVSKVPEITVLFWVVKVLTTGAGETTSDFLVRSIEPVIAVALGALGLAAALVWQFSVRRCMVSVFGTMAADVLHVGLGVPYAVSTPGFAILLVGVFVVWFRVEGSLSIHSITSRRREVFYWATVLTTFALGTAAGDLTATTLHLGFFASGLVFTAVIVLPGLAYRTRLLRAVPAFWFAYIVTRPIGASFADWMGLPGYRGGLGWGTGPVSLTLGVIIVALVAVLSVRHTTQARTLGSSIRSSALVE
jgi:uncharacterized membrane-anchored protein